VKSLFHRKVPCRKYVVKGVLDKAVSGILKKMIQNYFFLPRAFWLWTTIIGPVNNTRKKGCEINILTADRTK